MSGHASQRLERRGAPWSGLVVLGLTLCACGGRSTSPGIDAGDGVDAQGVDGAVTVDASAPADAAPPDAAVGQSVGAACLSADECAGNFCLDATYGNWPGGYCTQAGCALGNPETSCVAFGGDGLCIDTGDPGQPYGVCFDRCDLALDDADCRAGYECLDIALGTGLGVCLAAPVCGNGEVERGEECEPPGVGNCDASCQGLGTAPVGDPCTSAADCAGNACIVEADGWPGGYCTQSGCDLGSAASSCLPHGGDGFCVDVGEGGPPHGACFDGCDPGNGNGDCRTGYDCVERWDGSGLGLCFPAPVCGNGVVERGEECDPPGTATCDASCQGLGTAPVGDPCASAADCAGDRCLTAGDGWPGGYCSALDCDLAAPAASCAAAGGDGHCVDVGSAAQPYGMCFDRCDPAQGNAECRQAYECLDAWDGSGLGFCVVAPVCGNGVVERGEECEPPGTATCDASCIGLGTAPVGAPCASPADCAGNWCITAADGWPGGYCTEADCDLGAPDTSCAPAGGDGYCLEVGDGGQPYGACFDGCDPGQGNADCRTSYECLPRQDGSGLGLCFPEPVCGNGVVERGEECEPPGTTTCDGGCQGLGTAPVGDPCTSPADCDGNGCIADADGWPGGYCTQFGCDPANPLTGCTGVAGDARCMNAGTPQQPFGVCLDACFPALDPCRVGYQCQLAGAALWVCVPQ